MADINYLSFHRNLPDSDYEPTTNAVKFGVFNTADNSLPKLFQQVFDPQWWDTWLVGDVTSAIISLKMYPFKVSDPPSQPEEIPVKILDAYLLSNISYVELSKTTATLSFGYIDIPTTNSFLDYEPYLILRLYLPFYGYITLDNSRVLGKRLFINYLVDYTSGRATIYVDVGNQTTPYDSVSYFTGTCILSVDIPLSNNNGSMNNMNAFMSIFSLSMGVASGSTLTQTSSLQNTFNPLTGLVNRRMEKVTSTQLETEALGGVKSGLWSAFEASRPHAYQGQGAQGNGGWYGPLNCFLLKEQLNVEGYPDNIKSYYGMPLMENVFLNTLTGFTQVSDIHIDGLGVATASEIQEVETLLLNGVIL